jgi:hypothetical protein
MVSERREIIQFQVITAKNYQVLKHFMNASHVMGSEPVDSHLFLAHHVCSVNTDIL